jgi:hypothetical protein
VPQTADDATDNAVTDHQHADVDADVEGSATDRGSSKASLQRYRKASTSARAQHNQLQQLLTFAIANA